MHGHQEVREAGAKPAMRRRRVVGLTVDAGAWASGARAQQGGRDRRIGVLLPAAADDAEYPTLRDTLLGEQRALGWSDGHNVKIDVRWSGAAAAAVRRPAEDLAALSPDPILAAGSASAEPLLQVTRSIPDPVGAGFVGALARPGRNATGFTGFGYGLGGKWLEPLNCVALGVVRVWLLRDASIAAGIGQW